MTLVAERQEQRTVAEVARGARAAARALALLSNERRNEVLFAAADELERRAAEILAANADDCRKAAEAVEAGRMSQALYDRLRTSERGVREMALRVREVAALPDPLGIELAATALDDDLTLRKVSCPLGVIGIVFESRPDVIPQIASLALKSGNAVLLKGGSEALGTNTVLAALWRDVLARFPGVPPEAVNLLHSRADVDEMLRLDEYLALIVPRGSKEFVQSVAERSRIPVLGHGEGVCHLYVDAAADLSKALDIAYDAKVQYPAACNSIETLLVHNQVAAEFLPQVLARYAEAKVEVRGCARTLALSGEGNVIPATESDWSTEYSDLIISIKVVDGLDEALAHIHRYGSSHTEAIVTEDEAAAERFLEEIDAAGVYHNASTRFADGYRYGLGAEVGISTSRLHARGPVGLDGLTSYKYKLYGNGQTVASYSRGERTFKHRRLDP